MINKFNVNVNIFVGYLRGLILETKTNIKIDIQKCRLRFVY